MLSGIAVRIRQFFQVVTEQREVDFKHIYAKMRISDRKVYFDVELEHVLSCTALPNLGGLQRVNDNDFHSN